VLRTAQSSIGPCPPAWTPASNIDATRQISTHTPAADRRRHRHDDHARPPRTGPGRPGHPSQYWLVPDASLSRNVANRGTESAEQRFARAVRSIDAGQLEAGQYLVDTTALAATPLGDYALYYKGVALLGLSRYTDAETVLTALQARKPQGFLKEALPLRLAELALARADAKKGIDVLESITDDTLSAPEEVWLQLGRAAERAGDRDKALKAYRRVYYDYPLSAQASDAQSGIERLQTGDLIPSDRFARELERAGKLFDARRWAQARAGFEPLSRVAQGDDAQLIALRMAECDYYLDRFRQAREALRPFLKGISREAEARFFYLTATRALGDTSTYVELAQDFLTDFPDSTWTEEVLNNLASHYIIIDDDEAADAVFRDLYRRFPRSRHAERAAWKIGWRAYRSGNYLEAAEVFEEAAAAYPRADNRPAWLYWSARARDNMRDQPTATTRYRLVVADYENSYYGRLASKALEARGGPATVDTPVVAAAAVAAPQPVPTDAVVRALLALELYDVALREVQYAQRVWGDTPQLQATVAFIRHNQGLALSSFDRFNALRGAINTMRRAYPQFMAAGGEGLPPDVLRIIYPLDYWPLISKYSATHDLDPYLVAALMAQESTFTADVRSSANAYGLMQLLPSTASRYARRMGIRRFSASSLTQPETNVRIGTEYFKDLVDRFGGAHYALASYNAGENRVVRWMMDNPGLPQDEFIDDIPFPETQNYVKRILGTAEDYRRLYGGGLLDPNASLRVSGAAMTPARAAASRSASSKKVSSSKKSTTKKTTPKKSTAKKPTAKKSTAKRPARKSSSSRR
jgi:soluble lytic murein transglycosylase